MDSQFSLPEPQDYYSQFGETVDFDINDWCYLLDEDAIPADIIPLSLDNLEDVVGDNVRFPIRYLDSESSHTIDSTRSRKWPFNYRAATRGLENAACCCGLCRQYAQRLTSS
jgi:hypothetical protein